MHREKPLHELSIAEAGRLLRHGGLTATELTRAALHRIARLDGEIHAFAWVTSVQALTEAGMADAELKAGVDRGALHGIPYALKDLIDARGLPTKAGSRLRETHVALHDATVTAAMRKAGAVLLGKVATYELGTVGPSFDLPQPPAINPRAQDRITGGSSSGSAAAVAAGFVRVSIGTDSGGSVRSPPCYCGVVGLKPTYGLLPLKGILPLSPSLDHVGIVAASVEDAAICLDVLSPDSGALENLGSGLKALRIAYGRNWSAGEADAEMQAALDHAAQVLRDLGALVEEVTLPDYLPFEQCGTTIIIAEGYATYKDSLNGSGDFFGRATFENLSSGKPITAIDLTKALLAKTELTGLMDGIVEKYDALLVANTLAPAPAVADFRDGKPRWTAMRTFPFNVTGLPALAVPSGISARGLPLGLQLAARKGGEAMLCRIGHALETSLNLRFSPIPDVTASNLNYHLPNKDAAMTDKTPDKASENRISRLPAKENVLQVERRDYVDLAPNDRPRVQSLNGFEDIYTDIVDYIVRCTHRIWDERNIGLIYTHYTHNCTVYGTMGTVYNREDMVLDTIQRIVAFPERRGMATQVVWTGNDVDGFYTSHLVTGSGRHSQPGPYGDPTGRSIVTRTFADCMILKNRIYREWLVSDTLSLFRQLGLDPHPFAENAAKSRHEKGLDALDIGENRRLLGQYPPESDADVSIAKTDLEQHTIRWLHEVFNKRMLGTMKDVYAPTALYHGPLLREITGASGVLHQYLGLMGSIPDLAFLPQHICSVDSEEGGTKVALRWVIEGHHLGYGILRSLGAPTGKRLQVMGMSHFHYKNGKIVDEWTLYDEMSLLMQVKLAQMGRTD